ncbi:lipopolysaccharide biosynthesis protein [Nonomuraea purpurea]|uniref:Lipopolysaccharide biosynthesis protein n=1 Tax=Nonomuraea purpurea TaxID=1849276 RepID=A0ABV8GK38_9ACTN
MANTGITAVLGLGYWFLATHLYPPAEFGDGQTLISAMRLFSSLAGLAFVGTMARFIPVAGRRTGALILYGYAAASGLGLLGAAGFLILLPVWGDAYGHLTGVGPGLFFLGSVLTWTIFTLLDVTLAGLRKAVWVPVISVVYGLGKMAALAALAFAPPSSGVLGGVYLSWIVPAAVVLLPAGRLIAKVVRRHATRTTLPLNLAQVARFMAGDLPGALSLLLTLYLTPVMVAAWLDDPVTFGYFSLVHTLGCIVGLLAANVGVSVTVEAPAEAHARATVVRHALRRALVLVGPIVVITVAAAPLISWVFGHGAAIAVPLLRLMALAVLPGLVVEIYLATLRSQNQARKLAIVQLGLALSILGVTAALFPIAGIAAVGYATLASQSIVVLLILPDLRRALKLG